MAIATLDQYIAAVKQRIRFNKVSRTTVATVPFSVFELATAPAAGVLAGTSSGAGVVPTDATAGCPPILFSTGVGYLSKVEFGNSVACRLNLFDMVYKAGTYAYNSGTTNLSVQPVISSRCPDYPGSGTDFGVGIEVWVEVVTAHTSATAWQIQITYTDQAGNTGHSSVISVAAAAAALTVGKLFQIQLAAGDTGIQKLESVTITTGAAVAGTVNVLFLRPLWTSGRVAIANDGDVHDLLRVGMPIVYANSALYMTVEADSTASGVAELSLEIASA
jgi:hypothetical protein